MLDEMLESFTPALTNQEKADIFDRKNPTFLNKKTSFYNKESEPVHFHFCRTIL